jgi:hypothetical protein
VQNTIKDCEGDELAMRTFQSKIGTVVVHDRSRLGKMGRGRSLCRPSDGLNPENQELDKDEDGDCDSERKDFIRDKRPMSMQVESG